MGTCIPRQEKALQPTSKYGISQSILMRWKEEFRKGSDRGRKERYMNKCDKKSKQIGKEDEEYSIIE